MSKPDEVQRRLEQWGNDEQPSVDGAFANRLDSDLRAMHHSTSETKRPFWQPAVLALAALLVVAGGVFAFTRTRTDDLVVVMAAATETEVVLPDGEIVNGAAGLELPDGTQITVGADGSAVIAGVVLEAGTQAVINDGQLEIRTQPDATDSEVTGPSSTVAPTTTTRPSDRDSTTAPPSTRATTSSTRRTTTSTTRRSTTTAVTTPQTTSPPTSADQPSTTTADLVVVLEWAERDGRVRLTWTYAGPDTLAGWRVTVTSGDRLRTLAVLRDPAARAITVERLDGAASYRVIALDGDGAVIAESNTVAVPG